MVLCLNYKKMDFKEKILAGILLLIVFSAAINSYKNQQLQESFENMERHQEEIESDDFKDLELLREEMEELENIDAERFEDVVEPSTTEKTMDTSLTDIDKVVPNSDIMNYEPIPAINVKENKLHNIESRLKNVVDNDNFTNVPITNNTSPTTMDYSHRSVSQKDASGVNSIFSPQIIIHDSGSSNGSNNGSSGGSDISMRAGPGQPMIPLRRQQRRRTDWMQPEYDLWDDNINMGQQTRRVIRRPDLDNRGNNAAGNQPQMGGVGYSSGRKLPDANYQNSPKVFYPGYSYLPPNNWDVPQKRTPVCIDKNPDTTKLPIGIADHGTPINALEVDPIGRILTTEEKVQYTNVGSILPKFTYTEES